MNEKVNVTYKKFDIERNFGIELEMGNFIPKNKIKNLIKVVSKIPVEVTKYQLSSNNNFWHVKDDATCGILGRRGPKGVEVASYVAKGSKDINHIAGIASFLYDAGCRSNQNCGTHIHADVKDLDIKSLGTILSYWLKIETWIENSLPSSRINNKYCRKLSGKIGLDREKKRKPEDVFSLLAPSNLNIYENEERRVSLNLVNYMRAIVGIAKRKTIELRYPEGTLDSRDIKSWIYLFLSFIENCKDKDVPDNLLDCESIDEVLCFLGVNHTPETFFIFSSDLHDARIWFLQRLIRYGGKKYKEQAEKKLEFLTKN
jgi:hypothetical protein